MKLFELASPAEVQELERQLDKMMATLGLDVEFTRHFIERLLGRERNVSVEDVVQSFEQLKRKYKSKLIKAKKQPNYSAVLRDFDRDLNIVFGIKPDQQDGGYDLVNITIKQKDPSTFVTNTDGGENLRIGSKRLREYETDDSNRVTFIQNLRGPDNRESEYPSDSPQQKQRDKVLDTSRGDNYKKARQIAAKSKNRPIPDDTFPGSGDTPHTSQGNIAKNQMRLGK